MNLKKWLSFFAIISILHLVIWNLASLEQYEKTCCPLKGAGSSFGIAGYIFFACSLLLASRWRKLEDWIGGLDRVYHLHRTCGVIGFCLILIHPWVEAMKWLPNQVSKFAFMTLPLHGRFSVNLGSLAYWLTIIILGITLLKLLPYDKWKLLHKFMILVFILATFHVLLSRKRFGSEFSQSLILIPILIGFFGILYKTVFSRFFEQTYLFNIKKIRHVNYNVAEITLEPIGKIMCFIPGQYGFFSFTCTALSEEAHPFTFIGSPEDPTITLLVKARGDFTKSLYQYMKEGTAVRCEGPYGRFNFAQGGVSQIWIAGGIGIVPFIAWIRSMEKRDWENLNIDLYYCVHRTNDALFCEEFQHFRRENPRFRWFLHCSEENNRLDIQKAYAASGGLDGKKIFMCGPSKLTRDFAKKFADLGVKNEDIHFEEFEFF
jgi:predicted ferric reductase